MIESYSNNCDYLRKRFELHESINLYDMVSAVVKYLKEQDNLEELKQLEKTTKSTSVETKSQPKEKKCQKSQSKSKSKKK